MTGCCALGCTNKSFKGFRMKRFPRDPERRKVWTAMVGRENWEPTNFSNLCEVHFTPECFEQNRADGRKMLKYGAIPTIFERNITQKGDKSRKIKSSLRAANGEPKNESQSDKVTTIPKTLPNILRRKPDNPKLNLPSEPIQPSKSNETVMQVRISEIEKPTAKGRLATTSTSLFDIVPAPSSKLRNKQSEMKLKMARREKLFRKLLIQNQLLKNKLRQIRQKYKTNCESDVHLNSLKKVFREDQIQYLTKGHNSNWSLETIKNALKLKTACGINGYKELINQNYPLPSLRTLRRRLQPANVNPGILEDISDFLKLNVDDVEQSEGCLILDEMSDRPECVWHSIEEHLN